MNARAALHALPTPTAPPWARRAGADASDLALLGVILAIHLMPLAARATGQSWGQGTLGYATAVTIVAGRELLSELRARWCASRGGGR